MLGVSVELERHRFSVEDYYQLARAGVLREDDRVELIRGELLVMSPIGSRHAESLRRLSRALTVGVGDRAMVAVQDPLRMPDSEPQPDLMLLSPRPGGDWETHPRPADVLMLVEVADTTVAYDREVKLPLYAEAGIPEAWLVDLVAARLEMHRGPGPDGYRQITHTRAGDTVAPTAFQDVMVEVGSLLG
ncbi:MAG: Uma2 family endonuclease [Acidimicrobiales bacterium]|nr:MAG: Uma2 family endonuclease [Acidimicrobiales bacterium]